MAAKKKRAGVEWVGGIVTMPGYVTGEGAPYRAEVLVWMGAEGAVLGSTVGRPGALIDLACEGLRSTIAKPLVGRPHTPDRVRVASPELAEALREGQFGIDVVCALTPEIDEFYAVMRERMTDDSEAPLSYLSPHVGPAAVAAFFRAAAALFRAAPWTMVPGDQPVISVSIAEFRVTEAALAVFGQAGGTPAVTLFAGIRDFEACLDAVAATDDGENAPVPPHVVCTFERGADVRPTLRNEIVEHHWEVAGAAAYPRLIVVGEEQVERPPTAKDVAIAEAIALALSKVLTEKEALQRAWNGGEPVTRTLSVATHGGDVEVTLRIPFEQLINEYAPPYDVLAALYELGEDGDEIDPEARMPLEDELVRRFAASPDGKSLTDIQSCHLLMDLAADFFDATIATLDPQDLRELVFDVLPRKVSIDASAASAIIEQSRAFYAFLKREFGLEQADACLRVLGDDAVKELEAALEDPSKFGMAKSIVMAGKEAGFDMDSKEGIDAWMRLVQSKPLPQSLLAPALGAAPRPRDQATARARRNARKASRKARKKSR